MRQGKRKVALAFSIVLWCCAYDCNNESGGTWELKLALVLEMTSDLQDFIHHPEPHFTIYIFPHTTAARPILKSVKPIQFRSLTAEQPCIKKAQPLPQICFHALHQCCFIHREKNVHLELVSRRSRQIFRSMFFCGQQHLQNVAVIDNFFNLKLQIERKSGIYEKRIQQPQHTSPQNMKSMRVICGS